MTIPAPWHACPSYKGSEIIHPLVDVIIPTFNGARHLPRLLDNLRDQEGIPFTCTVVDDCSPDDIGPLIRDSHPWVRWVRQPRNMGPAHSRNLAAALGSSPFIAVFDDDTYLDDDHFLHKAVVLMSGSPSIGQLGGMILNGFDPSVLLDCGIGRTGPLFGGLYHGQNLDRNAGRYLHPRRVLGVCSAGMIVRREAFQRVGGFDPDYYYSCEDLDLSLRLHLSGYDVRYEPTLRVYHLESQAMGRALQRKMYLYRRNCLLALMENYPAAVILGVFYTLLSRGRRIALHRLGCAILPNRNRANNPPTSSSSQDKNGGPASWQDSGVKDFLRTGPYLLSKVFKIMRKRSNVKQYMSRERAYLLAVEREMER